MNNAWRQSTWGDEISLEYGKAIRGYQNGTGQFPVFGSNGPIGWTDKSLAPAPGVILGRKGAYRGVHFCEVPFFVIDTAYYVKPKSDLDMRWLYYAIIHHKLGEIDDGSPIPSTTRAAVYITDVDVPPIGEQREIAAILGALDDKIELNRKTAATLEAMARALYRSWFVDFDPVHAKAAGRAPAHMDAATADLFPDSFGEDGLPEGWQMGAVADVFDVTMGQSPPGNTYNEDGEGLPFYQGRTDFGFRFPNRRKFCSAPSRIAPRDSVLLSVRAPVGDLNRAWEECCIGRGVAALLEKSRRNAYGYEAIWALSEDLKSYDSEGTVFGSINKNQLAGMQLVVPSPLLQDAFEALIKPIDDQVRNITAENQTLATLRDTLLPRLMSGDLRVGETRKIMKETL